MALFVGCTRVLDLARILASLPNACILGGTISVNSAFRLINDNGLCTRSKTISFQRWIANTSFLMIVCFTPGPRGARIAPTQGCTCVGRQVTFFIGGTVVVACTLKVNALDVRASLQPWWAITNCFVVVDLAKGPSSTSSISTRIHTLLRNAGLV